MSRTDDAKVLLVCREGHVIHWSSHAWPRPRTCPAKAYGAGRRCENDMIHGMKLVPDDPAGGAA